MKKCLKNRKAIVFCAAVLLWNRLKVYPVTSADLDIRAQIGAEMATLALELVFFFRDARP
jgi:hypothetical protein